MELGVSAWTVSKSFSRSTGKRVLDYTRQRKLEYAAVLLSNTEEPVPRIDRSTGFGSRRGFLLEFSEAYKALWPDSP